MGPRSTSRRHVLKTGAAVASVGLVGSLAGCSDALDGNGDSDDTETPGGSSSDIPEGANVVMGADFQEIINDEEIRDAVNTALAAESANDDRIPSSVDGVFDRIEEEGDVDLRELEEVVLFGESEDDEETDYVGFLAYTNWNAGAIREAIEEMDDEDIEKSEHNGVTVYVNDDADEDTERIAVFEDGTIVFGSGGAVHDVIDVRAGDADPISGEIKEAWEATGGGYARIAVVPDSEDLPEGTEAADRTADLVTYVYGSLYADGSMRGFRINMETESEDDAREVRGAINSQRLIARDEAESEGNQELAEFLDETAVETDGTTVTITNEVPVDEITPFVERFVVGFVRGFRSGATGGTDVLSLDAGSAVT